MKFILLLILVLTQAFASATVPTEYPLTPDPILTPGSLCNEPDRYRYPEGIPYCERDHLESDVKTIVIQNYRKRGYRIDPSKRGSYKIDHMIPLCAGGSNKTTNLWPQHRNVYVITDPLEPLACKKLESGKITQANLVKLIIKAKTDLNRVREVILYLESL